MVCIASASKCKLLRPGQVTPRNMDLDRAFSDVPSAKSKQYHTCTAERGRYGGALQGVVGAQGPVRLRRDGDGVGSEGRGKVPGDEGIEATYQRLDSANEVTWAFGSMN